MKNAELVNHAVVSEQTRRAQEGDGLSAVAASRVEVEVADVDENNTRASISLHRDDPHDVQTRSCDPGRFLPRARLSSSFFSRPLAAFSTLM